MLPVVVGTVLPPWDVAVPDGTVVVPKLAAVPGDPVVGVVIGGVVIGDVALVLPVVGGTAVVRGTVEVGNGDVLPVAVVPGEVRGGAVDGVVPVQTSDGGSEDPFGPATKKIASPSKGTVTPPGTVVVRTALGAGPVIS